MVMVGVGWLSLGFAPIIIMKTYQGRMDILKETVLNFLTGIDWLVVIPSTLVVYFVLMLTAAKVQHLKNT